MWLTNDRYLNAQSSHNPSPQHLFFVFGYSFRYSSSQDRRELSTGLIKSLIADLHCAVHGHPNPAKGQRKPLGVPAWPRNETCCRYRERHNWRATLQSQMQDSLLKHSGWACRPVRGNRGDQPFLTSSASSFTACFPSSPEDPSNSRLRPIKRSKT
jgi:hypothetical protein